MNCSDMFAFNVAYILQLVGIHINCMPKLVALTFTIKCMVICNRVVNLWNCLPARDSHFEKFKSYKSFL